MPKSASRTYRWCDGCRRSYHPDDCPTGNCPFCGLPTREMSKFEALARGFMANELTVSDIRGKHRQLIRLIWTKNGMGEQYYRVIRPDVPYSKFEARVTDLLMRGAEEGWVQFVFPPAPTDDESRYKVEFSDEERFVQELAALFDSSEQES